MALSLSGALFAAVAHADDTTVGQTQTADMKVKLTVTAACSMKVDDLDFGTHASTDGRLRARTNARVTCTNKAPYTLTAENPTNYVMKNIAIPEATVAYTLYSDSAHANTLTESNGVAGEGTGTVQMVPIFGQVEATQLAQAAVGDYEDTVTLQLTY